MHKAIIGALAIALFTIGNASAQAPQSCDPEERVKPNDLTSPCRTITEIEINTVEYRVVSVPGRSLTERHAWSCEVHALVTFTHPMHQPEQSSLYAGFSGFNYSGHESGRWFETSTLAIYGYGQTPEGGFNISRGGIWHSYEYHDDWIEGIRDQSKRVGVSLTYLGDNRASAYDYVPKPEEGATGIRTSEIKDEMNVCLEDLAKARVHQQEIAAKEAEERRAAREAAASDRAEKQLIETAREIGRIQSRIDTIRLEQAKQSDTNVIELNLVLEANIQAGIEMDRQITELLIETRKKELAALEARADLVRSWVIDKQDKWDELASLQSDYQTRIDDLQDETAASLAELERTKATVSAAIVASEARARELNEQLRTSQADEAALNAQLAAAEAELAEARKRLQALESGDATPTPAP